MSPLLRQTVRDYAAKLRAKGVESAETPSIIPVNPNGSGFTVLAVLDEFEKAAEDWFDIYASQYCVLRWCESHNCVALVKEKLRFFVRSAVRVGAFAQSIRISDLYISLGGPGESAAVVELLLDRAKAFRNLGDYVEAIGEYRQAIRSAASKSDEASLSIALLLLGKLYGNYAGQQSLFTAFVGEAKNRLKRQLSSGRQTSDPRVQRYLAICHDALGQACRTSDSKRAEYHFATALRMNQRAGRHNGVSRSLAHLSMLRFRSSASAKDRAKHLRDFETALDSTRLDAFEEAGLAVRWLEYGLMLKEVDSEAVAIECLAKAKEVATRYCATKLLVRIAMAEAEMMGDRELSRSISLLSEARTIAARFRLRIQSTEVNYRLAQALMAFQDGNRAAEDLIETNRQICLELVNEVRHALGTVNEPSESEPEFALLSTRTRRLFRSTLLQDYENTILQLERTLTGFSSLLRRSERERQEALVLAVMNHMARELVHEIKLSLAGSDDDSPLGRVAKSLAEAGSEIDEIVRERSATDLATKSFLSIAKRLRENSFHVKDTALKLSKLKAFLAKNLRRPRNLDDWASIRVCSETAVAELKDQYPDSSRFISLAFGVEVEIRSSAELTTMVIRNLLRNALQARKYDVPAAISLSTDLRQDPNLELGLREANLRIVTKYGDSMTAERACNQIQSGLLGVPSSSEMGSGVGLDVARTVFVDLMGFSLSAVHEGCSAGLEITFRAAAGRVRVVEMSKVATA